jgi:serine/threonine protein kinase
MIGEKLGSFRIKETLGAGAMGAVYLAVHEPTGKVAALKIIGSDAAQKNNTSRRFERENDILKQFDHPNIVRWLGVGRYQGTSYLAMEYIQGVTLEQLLAERGALAWREVVELAIQICSALHYAHQRGVVHRDIKPSNLMITPQGRVKLTDFGIAKDLDATGLTATGRTLGTAAYMAPEQIRGTPAVSHKTDLYALGVVLYQMLTGRPPFQAASPLDTILLVLDRDPVPPRVLNPTAAAQRQGGRGPQGARRAGRQADGQNAGRPSLGRRGG